MFSIQDIQHILVLLSAEFGDQCFPLANNVERLANRTERRGLGMIIREQANATILHAQGGRYLGVVLEEAGYFQWNGLNMGIAWRIIDTDFRLPTIESRLLQQPIHL